MTAATYPPAHHVLRDLGVSGLRHTDHAEFGLPARPGLADASGGIRLGVIAALIDIAGAGLALGVVRPDWIATADLTCHLTEPINGDVAVTCRPLRTGSSTVVVDATVTDGRSAPCGRARMAFSRIPGSATRADPTHVGDPTMPVPFSIEGGTPIDDPVLDRCGVAETEPGRLVLDKTPYVENSFGTVNGGVVALVAEAAAVSAAGGGRAVDLQVHYLEQVGDGPVLAEATALRPGDPALFEVQLVDTADGRLTAIADVAVR